MELFRPNQWSRASYCWASRPSGTLNWANTTLPSPTSTGWGQHWDCLSRPSSGHRYSPWWHLCPVAPSPGQVTNKRIPDITKCTKKAGGVQLQRCFRRCKQGASAPARALQPRGAHCEGRRSLPHGDVRAQSSQLLQGSQTARPTLKVCTSFVPTQKKWKFTNCCFATERISLKKPVIPQTISLYSREADWRLVKHPDIYFFGDLAVVDTEDSSTVFPWYPEPFRSKLMSLLLARLYHRLPPQEARLPSIAEGRTSRDSGQLDWHHFDYWNVTLLQNEEIFS